MDNLALLVFCFVAGILLRKSGRMPETTPAALNGFIIHVSLPALILLHVHDFPLQVSNLYPVLVPWFLFAMGLTLFLIVARLAHWSAPTTGGLILSGSLANTSFVGLPMIETFYGISFLSVGIMMDTLGTYMVLSTIGIFIAVLFSADPTRRFSPAEVARKILLFPPFLALLLALALRPVAFPDGLESFLGRLGGTLAPLALLSVGYQLRLNAIRGRVQPLAVGLVFKLLLGPLLITFVLVKMIGAAGPLTQVSIFEAAMAPQIGAAIVAIEHKLDPELVTLMVGIGIPLSFVTVPLWWYFLQAV